jgi:hypothetical protein
VTAAGLRWLDPDPGALDGWAVRPIELDAVGLAAAVPAEWGEPVVHDEGRTVRAVVAGRIPGEGFVIVRLADATEDDDIVDWVQLPMSVSGGLDPETLAAAGSSDVLTWNLHTFPALAERLAVDEAHAFSALSTVTPEGDGARELVRSYVLLARRADVAWKIALTLSSACLPGTDEDAIDANDHIRARACLTSVKLG